MVLKQYYLGCLAHASYLIADQASGRAAVVDPQRDVDEYLDDAAALRCRIGHVLLTHFHADFVAGHLELRERAGAEIHLGARASAEYPFTPMGDGDTIQLGAAVRLVTLETPGHSPESISILVYDSEREGADPHAVLTGDTLFIGDVGRPDLRASLGWSAQELGGMLYDSLREKILPLPDHTLVYPAHGAGSLCGKNISADTVSTLAQQRTHNYALQPMSRESFVEIVTADQPDAPAYFTYDAILNTRERQTLEPALQRQLRPLALRELLELAAAPGDGDGDGGERVQVLDARDPEAFERAHLRGSLNVGLGGSYATWCGTLLDSERPIVLIAEPGAEREAAVRLGRIGFDSVVGYLDGGLRALHRERPDLVERIERIDCGELAGRLSGEHPPTVIDVRAPGELQQGRIEAALNLPLSELSTRLGDLDPAHPAVVLCATGYRSAIAASLLRRAGIASVADLAGGYAEWAADLAARVA